MSRIGILLVVTAGATGCGGRGNVDLLEARLRQQEDRLYAMDSQLESTQNELVAERRKAIALETQLASNGKSTLLPEQSNALFRAEGIQFNRLLTGGLNRDDHPGDEILTAVLVPHDGDGELLKLPGEIELELIDLTKPANQQQIGSWKFNSEEAGKHWHSGFFGSGYQFRVPWQQVPQSSKLLLHARFKTADGRQFDTSEQIQITPPAAIAKSPDVPRPPLRNAREDEDGPAFRKISHEATDDSAAHARLIPRELNPPPNIARLIPGESNPPANIRPIPTDLGHLNTKTIPAKRTEPRFDPAANSVAFDERPPKKALPFELFPSQPGSRKSGAAVEPIETSDNLPVWAFPRRH